MSSLELRVPPVVVVLLAALLMWTVDRLLPVVAWPLHWRAGGAAALLAGGVAVVLAGVWEFRAARTTVDPLHPANASAMVQSGIYLRTRNPMYLGMLLALCGWAVWLASPAAMVVLPIFVLYLNRFQIVPEERALAALFGSQFDRYRGSVRRWL